MREKNALKYNNDFFRILNFLIPKQNGMQKWQKKKQARWQTNVEYNFLNDERKKKNLKTHTKNGFVHTEEKNTGKTIDEF